jgi:hypothetical protein
MVELLDSAEIDARFAELTLGIEDLETLEAPDFWSGALGVLAGAATAGAVVAGVIIFT